MGMQGGDGGSGRVRSSAGRGSEKITSFGQIVLVVGLERKYNPHIGTTSFISLQHMVRS